MVAAIHLTGVEAWAQVPSDTTKVHVAFTDVEKQDLLGGVTAIDVEDLMKKEYYTGSTDGLQSFVGGYDGNTWGQSPLVLVDGVPRDASTVLPSQIESITVMKAASALVLYGSRAAKGAVLITTKKGKEQPLSIDMRANTGLYVPKSYPNYLDAASYMTLYNEARANDGLSALYSDADIYNTAMGTNPYRYPDTKYFTHDNLRRVYNKTDVTGEVTGGNDNAKYYANMSLTYNNTLLKYGQASGDNYVKFNLLSNVELKVTDWMKAFASAGVIIENTHSTKSSVYGFWNQSANLRPNWFAPLLPIDQMDMDNSDIAAIVAGSGNVIDGKYLIGGRSTDTTNAFADLSVAGYEAVKQRNFSFQVGLDAKLDMLLKGLSFKTLFNIDYMDYYTEDYNNTYAVYEPTWSNVNGKDVIVDLTQYNLDKQSTSETVDNSSMSQVITFSAQFDYNRQFNRLHNVSATLVGWGFQEQDGKDENNDGSTYHRTSNVNLGLSARYNYDRRYYADFGLAVVHSAKLPENHRNALSPSITLGWRLDKENFMQNVTWVDNLKLTAAYSLLHQDIDISDYYLYKSTFNTQSNWFQWKDASQGGWFYGYVRGDNDQLRMLTREEYRVGLEGSLLKGLVKFDFNLFTQDTDGGLISDATTFPSYYATAGLTPYINYNNDRRQGFDFSIYLNKRVGKVDATLGFMGMLYRSKALRRDEAVEYDYLRTQGRSLNASWGYVCEGFLTQDDIDGGYTSTLGSVQAGDLKYQDVNGDGQIDTNDRVVLGNSGNPFTFGVNLTLKWKDFTLFALGSGQAGGIGYKNNTYWWVYGDRKYSEVVWGRWTPETADTATYPRLTTQSNTNNFQSSTFWRYNTRCFKLNRVQLTYNMPEEWFMKNKVLKGMSVYVSGESLLTISKEHKYMEMNIGTTPQCRFYNLGVTAKF
ncbi:MAG: SusC/RagA family TonB-linked outer membrane protein [Prevotellaceae bacterium]|nr:SusC/RagA family TonB-linked outer membrane protein [Prevotellaceae bacterium]